MSETKPEADVEETSESEPEIVIDAAALSEASVQLDEMMADMEETEARVDNFTAPTSRIEHGHGLEKGQGEGLHDIRARFDVRDEFVANNFFTMPNDHLALFELVERKAEFQSSDERVFDDVSNTNRSRWREIESFVDSNRAPVPDRAVQRLRRRIDASR